MQNGRIDVCQCCDLHHLQRLREPGIGMFREEVTEVLEKISSQLKVIRSIRPIYACRACEMVSKHRPRICRSSRGGQVRTSSLI
jgi:transposase